jgi:hypothetical protein
VRWCLFRSASRANCFVQPSILQGQAPAVGPSFGGLGSLGEALGFDLCSLGGLGALALWASFFSSGYGHAGLANWQGQKLQPPAPKASCLRCGDAGYGG